jgi:hypothetical protein
MCVISMPPKKVSAAILAMLSAIAPSPLIVFG